MGVKPVQPMFKTNTHALKITDHVHFLVFKFVKIWIKITHRLSAAKKETTLLKVLKPPQKQEHMSWVFLVR